MKLPMRVDKTPEGKIVDPADIGCPGYAENCQCELQLTAKGDFILVGYYCEDDTWLENDEVEFIINKANS